MRLTWRDGVTMLLALLVVGTFAAYATDSAIPVLNDARGVTLLIGIVGLSMCIVGGSGETIGSKDAFTIPAGILGGAALVLIIAGLVTGWPIAVTFLVADTLILWALSTVRHGIVARSARAA
jgi:hypothetical protein